MKISYRPKAGHRRITEETRCNDDEEEDEEELLGLRVEDRYHALYEERMNPFDQVLLLLSIGAAARTLSHLHAPSLFLSVCLSVCIYLCVFIQFSLREKQRKLNELPVADRIILNTAMALISSQLGRK